MDARLLVLATLSVAPCLALAVVMVFEVMAPIEWLSKPRRQPRAETSPLQASQKTIQPETLTAKPPGTRERGITIA